MHCRQGDAEMQEVHARCTGMLLGGGFAEEALQGRHIKEASTEVRDMEGHGAAKT